MTDTDGAVSKPQMFSGAGQCENGSNLKNLLTVTKMWPAARPTVFPRVAAFTLPKQFRFGDKQVQAEEFLQRTGTGGLLVLQDGCLRLQQYWLSGGQQMQWISCSVAKSFISALVGIALDQGSIGSIEEPISRYVAVDSQR